MADRQRRHKSNVPGPYYTDDSCIDCNLCRTVAPDLLAWQEEEYSYVCRQPATKDEESLIRQAMSECPVEAIGDDGEGR